MTNMMYVYDPESPISKLLGVRMEVVGEIKDSIASSELAVILIAIDKYEKKQACLCVTCQGMLSNAHNVQFLCTVYTCTVVLGFS